MMRRHAVTTALLLAFLSGLPAARADVSLNNMFGDHMVLQQGLANRIWGRAEPGEEVTVSIAGQSQTTKANDAGNWEVRLEPLTEYGGPHTLTVTGNNEITFNDVLVGEVWICSGQSNMQWAVNQANDPDLEKAAANDAAIRLISVPQVGTQEPQWNFKGRWSVCSPETVGDFSAVGYFFGRQLHRTLGVPIGLIDNAWGGSAADAWVKREKIAAHETLRAIHDRWTKLEETKADDQRLMAGNSRPGNIHAGVLTPSIGYGIRGVIWYQGESNAGRAHQYRTLFPFMIESWREEWAMPDNAEFPFYWVQLADFKAEKTEPAESDWAELREAQTMTMKALPNTGEAVIIDAGEGRDIHPRDKQTVAKRLARWALAKNYGVEIVHQSPRFKSMEIKGNKAVLTFDHVGAGLYSFDVRDPKGFAVCGQDQKFVWANARIVGKDKVEVWAEGVTPAQVRYAWAVNPVCTLMSREGLPATPFRTDDFKMVTEGQ